MYHLLHKILRVIIQLYSTRLKPESFHSYVTMLLIDKTIYPIQNHVPNITMDNVMCVRGCVGVSVCWRPGGGECLLLLEGDKKLTEPSYTYRMLCVVSSSSTYSSSHSLASTISIVKRRSHLNVDVKWSYNYQEHCIAKISLRTLATSITIFFL